MFRYDMMHEFVSAIQEVPIRVGVSGGLGYGSGLGSGLRRVRVTVRVKVRVRVGVGSSLWVTPRVCPRFGCLRGGTARPTTKTSERS